MFPPILDKVLGLVDKALQAACVALLSVIAFAVTFQVAARYVVSTSTPWTVELAAICFVWLSMFAIALGVRRGRHMVLDVFEYAPYRRWLVVTVDLVSGLAVIAILFALMYFGFAGLKASFSRTLPDSLVSLVVLLAARLSLGPAPQSACAALGPLRSLHRGRRRPR